MTQSYFNKFQVPKIELASLAILLVLLVSTADLFSQTTDNRGKNNPYSPSPTRKAKQEEPVTVPATTKSGPNEVAFVMQGQDTAQQENRQTIAQQTFKIAKSAEKRSMPPTETYKVGVGDVLFVNLKNATGSSGYYTVRPSGTIDFPLAGENLIVADQTIDDIEEMLASGITLFPDPQIEVKVREYGSHRVTVSGMVDHPGEKNLQREAIPLYVIRAEAIVDPKATKAVITRAPLLKLETYDLRDGNTDNVLMYPGNSVEFKSDGGSSSNNGFYFISGEVVSSGQKELTAGITLYQAVTASGGAKGDPRKVVIRRKNEKGVFVISEYDLRSIKNGKAADPALSPGDVIEIKN